jgi:hypothetical protein
MSLKGKDSKRIGDEKGDITFDSFIPFIDSSIIAAGGSAAKLKLLKANKIERKNAGGIVGGSINRGKYSLGSQCSLACLEQLKMLNSKEKLDYTWKKLMLV